MVAGIRAAIVAALFLGAVMALGDSAWAATHIQHRVAYGLAHGAIMCARRAEPGRPFRGVDLRVPSGFLALFWRR